MVLWMLCWGSCRVHPWSSAAQELRWRQPCRRGQLQRPQTAVYPQVSSHPLHPQRVGCKTLMF